MTGTAAEALELALWLYRAPARRNAVIGRPLPEGIGKLLRVATGAEDALADASRIAGEPPGVVLEAVRFYLQQVLFHEEADAYRVLGLRDDASTAQAREHHRLLQHWLHPDRRDSDEWGSVYAGRVNSAWTQLRTPQARQAYDAARVAQRPMAAPPRDLDHPAGGPIPVGRWHGAPDSGSPAFGRNVTIAVLAGCVGLLVLIALRPEAPPQWVEDVPPSQSVAAVESDASDSPFAILDAALSRRPAPPPPVPVTVPATVPAALQAAAERVLPATPPEPLRAQPVVPAEEQPAAASDMLAAETPVHDASPRPVTRSDPPPARELAIAVAQAPKPVAPSAQPPADAVPRTSAIASIDDPLARMTQARDRARLVVAYLDDPQAGPPPVWNDVGTARDAERIRNALHGRLGSSGALQLVLRAPKWRLSADGAHLESGYRAASEQGRLGIDFVWREEQLLVRGLSVEPAT